jgi:hypothetical protein
MPLLTWINHHRLWALGMGFALVVVAVAFGAWFFVFRSPGTQVSLSQALRLYRSHQNGTARPERGLIPAPGVYDYRTSGYERLSMGSISRRFPSTSAMIVTAGTCTTVRWVPFVQHMEGLVECPLPTGAVAMASAISDEDIAGTHTTETIRCPEDAYFLPARPTSGLRWSATCRADGRPVGFTGTVLGPASVAVAGHRRPSVHTRITLTFRGNEHGTNPTDYWIATTDGVILQEREEVDVSDGSGPLGAVRYSEAMSVALRSTAVAR